MSEYKIEVKPSVSPSSMNRYFGCPAQWRYGKLFEANQIPEIYTESKEADLGTNFHSAIIPGYFERVSEKPNSQEIEIAARDSFEENFDRSLWTLERTAKTVLDNFITFERMRAKTWKKYLPEFTERKFVREEFNGIVDFYCDGIILDWKTGGHVEMNQDLMRQGRTYIYLCETEDPPIPVRKVLFPALQIGKVLELPALSLGWLESERRRFINMASTGDFQPIRSFRCGYCSFILRCWNDNVRGLWD